MTIGCEEVSFPPIAGVMAWVWLAMPPTGVWMGLLTGDVVWSVALPGKVWKWSVALPTVWVWPLTAETVV